MRSSAALLTSISLALQIEKFVQPVVLILDAYLQKIYVFTEESTVIATEILIYYILDVGNEKEQKQELGWRVSVLPIIPALHSIMCTFPSFS